MMNARSRYRRVFPMKESSIQNIYQLDGHVPLLKAVPFGLQHILAMFVSNLTPIRFSSVRSRNAILDLKL